MRLKPNIFSSKIKKEVKTRNKRQEEKIIEQKKVEEKSLDSTEMGA